MKFCIQLLLSISLFLSVYFVRAQDSIPSVKFRRNSLKIGTNLFPNKLFISYEHALTKHISVGATGSISAGYYGGKTGCIYGRYYFAKYHGWFLEARGSYSYIDSYMYTSYYQDPAKSDRSMLYDDRHKATITYLSGGISGGYRAMCTQRLFFDFLAGVHTGEATFGKNDNYISRSPIELSFGTDNAREVFYTTGPGNPFHFMIQFGFLF